MAKKNKSPIISHATEPSALPLVYLKDDPHPLPIAIDFEKYAKILGDADPNDPYVRNLIETLFGMLGQIAAIHFGTSPSQIACGQLPEITTERHIPTIDVIKSEGKTTIKDFANATKGGRE